MPSTKTRNRRMAKFTKSGRIWLGESLETGEAAIYDLDCVRCGCEKIRVGLPPNKDKFICGRCVKKRCERMWLNNVYRRYTWYQKLWHFLKKRRDIIERVAFMVIFVSVALLLSPLLLIYWGICGIKFLWRWVDAV